MLAQLIPSLKNSKFIYWLDKILCSPYYVGFIALISALAEIFSFEFVTYYTYIVLGMVLPALFCHDMTPCIAPFLMMHITMSKATFDQEKTVLLGKNLHHFIIMSCLFFPCFISRLLFDIIKNPERRTHFPRLLIGYGLLCIAYALGGLFSEFYSWKNFGFGLLEFVSISIFYFYLLYSIDWLSFKKDLFAWIFLCFGLALSLEVLAQISKGEEISTGWACRNDLGGLIAMTIGGAGYLTIKKPAYISYIFSIAMFYLLTVAFLTGSRGGSFATFAMVTTCIVLIMVFAKKPAKIVTLSLTIAYIVALVLFAIFKTDQFTEYFGRIFNFSGYQDINEFSSNRIRDWKIGLEQWFHHPIFGVGWFECNWRPHYFYPKYHDTYVQLLASTGILGLGAYIFHRIQTIRMTFKKPALEKSLAFICIIGLMTANLVDCHFFNIWPGLSYAFLLAFIEGRNIKRGIAS